MVDIDHQQVRSLADDGDEPHLSEPLLRFLIQEKVLSLSETAEVIESVFEYSVSKSMVHRAKKKHEIRDPITAFDDVINESDSEHGQPAPFLLDRSSQIPVHPLDCDCYSISSTDEGGDTSERNDSSSTTPQSVPTVESDSIATKPQTPDSDLSSGTGVYKGGAPWRVTVSNRECSLVCPPTDSGIEKLSKRYHACNCGNCQERHFLDGDSGTIDCPNPIPVTISGARRIYQKSEGSLVADGVDGNDAQRGLQKYAKLMKADSGALTRNGTKLDSTTYNRPKSNHDDLTTVLLSLRVSPTDSHDRIITPLQLIDNTLDAWQEALSQFPSRTNDTPSGTDMISSFWTLAGTDHWATVHVHQYSWWADSDDLLDQAMFKDTVTEFVECSAYAADCHFDDDGQLIEGPVRIEHDPLLADPERLAVRMEGSSAFNDILNQDIAGPHRLTKASDVQSRGAIYIGTQLPELALHRSEPLPDVEFAAFIDALKHRNTSYGAGDFHELQDDLKALREFDEEQQVTAG